MKTIDLVDVIQRSALSSKDDVLPLLKYLGMDADTLNKGQGHSRAAAEEVAEHLRKMGSNDIATIFRGEGVPYAEVVLDVGRKLKAEVGSERSIADNEEAILWKLFADALEKMSDEEKRTLFQSMGIKEHDYPAGPAAAIIGQLVARSAGFAVYRTALIVANMVSRALLGQGLAFATNAALTRSIGVLLGPIGWIASGLWLAVDIAGPAFRKTVPAVIHVAMLRQMLMKRVTIGVVGDASSGKDSLIHAVFGLPSNIDPVAGSTKDAMVYPLSEYGNANIINYPGFNDPRPEVNAHINDYLHHTDVFILVVDWSGGVSGTDVEILEKLKLFKDKPILICLNKVDLARSDAGRASVRKAAEERLGGYTIIETAFDPDLRLSKDRIGCAEVYQWISERIRNEGKDPDALPKFLLT